jgi:hypothetical protein
MATFSPNKTNVASASILDHQAATHPTTIVGTKIDASTKRGAVIFMFHGYVEAAADTNPGSFKVQIRPDDGSGSVTEHWITVATFTAKGTTPDTEAMTATEPVGETTLACASTTGFAVDDLLYIQNTTLANSEWAECKTLVTNTNIQLIDGLTTEQTSSSVIWNDASRFVCALDLNSVESFRVVWSHEGATGANGHVKVMAITYDSDNSA